MSIALTILLIVLLPMVGGFLSIAEVLNSKRISTVFVTLSCLMSFYGLLNFEETVVEWNWTSQLALSIRYDQVSAILLSLVTFISTLVHVFSIEYVNDTGYHRYFLKLGFFTSSMLGLLIANHLVLFFICWELVGFASYLLIGYWYKKDKVVEDARHAFMINRIADVALFSGILILVATGQSTFSDLSQEWLFLPSLLVALGAFGKSAQLPFSGWLIRAMSGPTPVSALIHAATMVAAGVYLLARVGTALNESVLVLIATIGALTTLYGAICAVIQNDIKKVLAYSTISQLGYMVMGIGVGAGEASLFHLWTHAFFKAGLFLGAGAIIHSLSLLAKEKNIELDAQDIRMMGGMKSKLPWTYASFLVCSLALAGIPFFSGFMSKEGILIAAWSWAEQNGTWAYLIPDIGLITVMITAFYIGRLLVLVFIGTHRWEPLNANIRLSESWLIRTPLIFLAIGSLWFFYNTNPLSHSSYLALFLGKNVIKTDSFIATYAGGIAIFFAFGGLLLAYTFFRQGSTRSENSNSMGSKVVSSGFFLVPLYNRIGGGFHGVSIGVTLLEKGLDRVLDLFAISMVVMAKLLAIFERLVVDGLVNFSAWFAQNFGRILSGVHARTAQAQLIWLLIGVVLILLWILFF